MNPEMSKFKDESIIKKHRVESKDNEQLYQEDNETLNQHAERDSEIKNSIERRVTCSMKKLITREEQSVNAINSLIIPGSDRYKIRASELKLH